MDQGDIVFCVDKLVEIVRGFKGNHFEKEKIVEMIARIGLMNNQHDSWKILIVGMPYRKYLETQHWKNTAEQAKKMWGGRCALCNSNGPLDAHHRTYLSIGIEKPADVICLCRECHEHFHNGRKAEGQKPREAVKASRTLGEGKAKKLLPQKQSNSSNPEQEDLEAAGSSYDGIADEDQKRAADVFEQVLRELGSFTADVASHYSEVRVARNGVIHVLLPDDYLVQLCSHKSRIKEVTDCFSRIYGSRIEVQFMKG